MRSSAPRPDATAPHAQPLWSPSPDSIAKTRMAAFMDFCESSSGAPPFGPRDQEGYAELHRWSVREPEKFWSALWDFCGVIGDKGQAVMSTKDDVPWVEWFADSRLSYSENMLSRWQESDAPALVARLQGEADVIYSGKQLCAAVSIWAQALERAGVREGDCVGLYLSNRTETDIILLATAHIGAVFCSAGMEMGADDLIARMKQAKPRLLISTDGYAHGAKTIDRMTVLHRAAQELPGLEKIILVKGDAQTIPRAQTTSDFLEGIKPQRLEFTRRPFSQPLYILFSSGSTGAPKCFVHGAGNVLMKHLCEHQLSFDARRGDRVFYHTTPSWMMWNLASSVLACGATLLKYDGDPFYPDALAQWRFTAAHGCTHFGTAAPLIMAWKDAGMRLKGHGLDLSTMRMIIYTGAVLPESGFYYLQDILPVALPVYGISGGTDLVGSHVGGNPLSPVYAGQVVGPLLGMDIQIWDENANPLPKGQAGELVCASPFPSMPLYFLGDKGGAKYRDAYFDFYEPLGKRVWRHGDSIMQTPQGQLVIIGRSDATLNQNGVRIGTGAIYGQLTHEKLGTSSTLLRGAAAVDFIRPDNKQAITILFLHVDDHEKGVPEELAKAIRKAVKDNVGPYSIPTEILAAPGLLKTPNGKLAEVVIRKILAGDRIPNPTLYGEDLVRFYEKTACMLQDKYTSQS